MVTTNIRKTTPALLHEWAEALLDREVTHDECAEILCISPRSWRKLRSGEKGARIADGQIKLFCWEVALMYLDAAETHDKTRLAAVLGGATSVDSVYRFLERAFARFDPVEEEGSR